MRTIDVMECAIRKTEKDFRIDGCISQAHLNGHFEDNYHKQYVISKKIQYY